MQGELTFHQAIFGYDSGHHLLEASLNLSTDQRHFLAVATDLSGSAPASGFEIAYTGLPLPGTKYYALFCTWLAQEMPRPGSVWSHVLFIDFDNLARIADLGALRRVFRRPSASGSKSYSDPVRMKEDIAESSKLTGSELPMAEGVLEFLYAKRNNPVVILSSDQNRTEDLVFALWSQQWSRLRRAFRFSTGSFADRGRGDSSFDLQVSPTENRRVWQREGEYTLIDNKSDSSLAYAESWIRSAAEDLAFPNKNGLRTFFDKIGPDIRSPRSAFANLVKIHELIRSAGTAEWFEVLETVGAYFPEREDALILKETVCNPTGSIDLDGTRSLSIASFLLASDKAAPFESVSLNLTSLSQRLWMLRRWEVLDLLARLVRQPEKESAYIFARGIAEAVQPNDLESISNQWPELLPLIFGQNLQLALREELWCLPVETQRKVYEVLDGLHIEPAKWAEIISRMRPGSTVISARNLVRNADVFAMDSAFRWLQRDRAADWIPSEEWREALAQPAAETLMKNYSLPPVKVAFCAWLLAPQVVPQLLNASREDIQKLANESPDILPSWLRPYTSFLLVTLGLRSRDTYGVKCLVRGFFSVYDSLASGNYPSECWILLSPVLPSLSLWMEWDRCKKLRRAIRDLPRTDSMHVAEALIKSATTPEHMKLALELRPR